MSLRALPPLSPLLRACARSLRRPRCAVTPRPYATITPSILEPRPPPEPPSAPSASPSRPAAPGPNDPDSPQTPGVPPDSPPDLDARVLQLVRGERSGISLASLLAQLDDRVGEVLPTALKYEPSPAADRRIRFSDHSLPGVVAIAHATGEGAVNVCSGFAIEQTRPSDGSQLFVTCAHTLEEMRRTAAEATMGSGTFVLARSEDDNMQVYRATAVPSALPRSDVMLIRAVPLNDAPPRTLAGSFQAGAQSSVTLHDASGASSSFSGAQIYPGTPLPHTSGPLFRHAAAASAPSALLDTLPVSPYPVHPGTRIRAHFVRHAPPVLGDDGWVPWVGGMWRKWVKGQVVGYRDFAGKEAKPGTYDSLSHLLFEPVPSPGSSGGPIVDEETGAVVGVVLGARMDSTRIDGMRGWGVPSETILEMFSLPGLEGKQ